MVSNLVPYYLQQVMETHNSCLYMSQEAAHHIVQMDFSFRGPHLGLGSIQGIS